jgi:hypothetical protein
MSEKVTTLSEQANKTPEQVIKMPEQVTNMSEQVYPTFWSCPSCGTKNHIDELEAQACSNKTCGECALPVRAACTIM